MKVLGNNHLSLLYQQFKQLQRTEDDVHSKAQRGLALERLLTELFRQQGIVTTGSFRISGEQLDGAFEHKGWTYLVEVRWCDQRQSTDALYAFQGKPDRRIEGTRGLFISMSGYYQTSLDRFSEGRKPNTLLWTGDHIIAILEGRITVPELVDLSVRYAAERSGLLLPLDSALRERSERLLQIAVEGLSRQVAEEISTNVGRKFIPNLYIERTVERNITRLVNSECELEETLARLMKTGITIPSSMVESDENGRILNSRSIAGYLLGSGQLNKVTSVEHNYLKQLLDDLAAGPKGQMHVFTSRAGMGKTNLLCHVAIDHAREQPTIFITGRSGITSTTSIRELIESKLVRHLSDPFPRDRCFEYLLSMIQANETKLLVVIDAINEHRDFDVMSGAISQFLHEVAELPVLIVASCRDVYWPFFDTSSWPASQWQLTSMGAFSRVESEQAIGAYFDYYHLSAALNAGTVEKLRHPLVLRFFCEAYGDPDATQTIELRNIQDIRLKNLFDKYLDRKLHSICYTSPRRFRDPRTIENFLFKLADRMRTTKSRDIPRGLVSKITAEEDLDSPESTYVSILGEDILLEEEPDQATGTIKVVFTYDEFMEYMIARSILRFRTSKGQAPPTDLVRECETYVEAFPSLVGVFEYLAVILREDYDCAIWDNVTINDTRFAEAICRSIYKLGTEFVDRPELSALRSLLRSPALAVRRSSIQLLNLIISGKDYSLSTRAEALEILAEVLANEDDLLTRVEAIKYFDVCEDTCISTLDRELRAWWNRKKSEALQKPIVVSESRNDVFDLYRYILEGFICKKVYSVHGDENPVEFIKQVKPALIITALATPVISGDKLATLLKQDPVTKLTPILLISTSVGNIPSFNKIFTSDLFCGVLPKPYDPIALRQIVQTCLVGKM